MSNVMGNGKVFLVGAGPGDPGLLTVKGLECIRRADVIVYDRLVHPEILKHASETSEMIYVGKASSAHTMKQDDINSLLVEKAREGKTVVRLKGGDPFVFGRGGEEAETLVEAGIEFEVVPGVTSAVAAPAYAGIPITHRDYSSSVKIITGHQKENCQTPELPNGQTPTLIFLMGVENLDKITADLIADGRNPETPAALVRWGTWSKQETLIGTLGDIAKKAREADFKSPAVTIIGEVVKLREKLRWFDNRPLFGKKVLVTRSREQASELSKLLRKYGAEPIEFPLIKISPPDDFHDLDNAIESMEKYDWMIFTSVNAVRMVEKRLRETGNDIRHLKDPKIAAIGPKTAETAERFGLRVDFTPSTYVAESVAEEFPDDLNGMSVLIPRAKEAREILPEKLSKMGAEVDAVTVYKTEAVKSDLPNFEEIDIITFTSSSTVKNFIKLVEPNSLPKEIKIACIGPITAQTAEEYGLKPDIIAEEYTIEGLVKTIAKRIEELSG